jgi:hypothetical protein
MIRIKKLLLRQAVGISTSFCGERGRVAHR